MTNALKTSTRDFAGDNRAFDYYLDGKGGEENFPAHRRLEGREENSAPSQQRDLEDKRSASSLLSSSSLLSRRTSACVFARAFSALIKPDRIAW